MEMYLVNQALSLFWHCRYEHQWDSGMEKHILHIRSGEISKLVINSQNVTQEPPQNFLDFEQAVEYATKRVQRLKCKGYDEVDGKLIRTSAWLSQKKEDEEWKPPKKANVKQEQKQAKFERKLPQLPPIPVREEKFNVLLADTWQENVDPKGYLMSEKLDGMRAVWKDGFLYSRNGKIVHAPPEFTANWPREMMDGELWLGRGKFQELISITRKQQPVWAEWKSVCYMVFDLPEVEYPFRKRYEILKRFVEEIESPYLHLVKHEVCASITQMQDELIKVEGMGGEGLMLRDPDSFYEGKRSKTLLKVKSHADDDALVIGYETGMGKIQGLTGALRVRSKDGVYFQVGSGLSQELRQTPPKIGTTITYKYFGRTKEGKPRFPIFVRVKSDANL